MVRKLSALASCVLLAAASVVAGPQGSRPQTDDPISGTWTGQLVLQRDASNVVQITMELKFDGKRGVSGTFTGLPTPGDVKSGTFDPKSGALKLGLGKQDEPAVLLVLEGTVSNGTAAGHFTGEESGDFRISRKG
jgi:hypothetical protein